MFYENDILKASKMYVPNSLCKAGHDDWNGSAFAEVQSLQVNLCRMPYSRKLKQQEVITLSFHYPHL